MDYSISVIIPVYNGAAFIEQSIKSALEQPEVNEVVVVNDGSTDDTGIVLRRLQKEDDRVKVYTHERGINKGRSASRNLALKKATSSLVAFLDADDYYLEERFKNDLDLFKQSPEIDGVYNAIGVHFYRAHTQQEFKASQLTTVTKVITPSALFEHLLYYKSGHFSIDGFLLKTSVLKASGVFDETLQIGEDTAFILKTALVGKLVPGIIDKPVAARGVHDDNVFNQKDIYTTYRWRIYESLLFWAYHQSISLKYLDMILDLLWRHKFIATKELFSLTGYWLKLFFKLPKLLFSKLSIKYFPLVRQRQRYFSFLYPSK